MATPELHAEKITHPFQLMAAWFVMLIILVGLLLTAAAKINRPSWISAFLVISAVALSLVVMLAVFLMLTRFRPHLQDAKEYATWLKDERRFSNRSVERLSVREVAREQPSNFSLTNIRTENADFFHLTTDEAIAGNESVTVEVVPMRGAKLVVKRLQADGITATIYRSEFDPTSLEDRTLQASRAIWIGSDILPSLAILIIKTSVEACPQLCYLHLSSDSAGPDFTHTQMFIGGATSTAQEYGLEPWSRADLLSLPEELSLSAWHALVRKRYGLA